jgi:hypothetical protein
MTRPEEKAPGEHEGGPELDRSLFRSTESSHGESSERAPRLRAKTFLAVAAVCLIYFAQLVSLVGAGVVSYRLAPPSRAASQPGVQSGVKLTKQSKDKP